LAVIAFFSCGKEKRHIVKVNEADSLINVAYHDQDYGKLLTIIEQADSTGAISHTKANYWRGYVYSRQRKMRLAENYWTKAIEAKIENEEDLEFYAKSANRLAGTLLLRGEFETTLRVALPALQKMDETGHQDNSNYAYLLVAIGGCQLNLGRYQEAADCFKRANRKFMQTIAADKNIANYKSAIAGIITITDNYLLLKHFEEAYLWTERLDELLQQYAKAEDIKPSNLDKQQARLYLYRACALEGLNHREEAARNYTKALATNYAKTGDGKLEATNYLISARRWKEAATNFRLLDVQLAKYDIGPTLENIPRYILPKLKANIYSQRTDSAIATALKLCDYLDSAIAHKQQDDAIELATIYNTQQKETQIAQQKAELSRQRMIATVIASILIIVFFILFIYNRHQAAKRLEKAFLQLEIANARAEESSRMKTAFIQQISHEIRTPLNILSGFTQVITTPDIDLNEETRNDINQKITENTNRITGLVNKMLELSDVSSRAVIERNEDVPVVQIAAQAAEDSRISDDKNLSFDLQIGKGIENAAINTNLQQAARALTLLLDNARKYTQKGNVTLKVTQQKETIAFIVEDTGIGVPASEAEHIFEEFVQLDEFNEGTGIGLTVSRSICRRLGGNVLLDTSYTTGARFVMTLPTT
jgi:signal transduction histidine kinase